MASPRSTIDVKAIGNFKAFDEFKKTLRLLPTAFKSAVENVSPEFGAYMSYSFYLEVGTKTMPARPHIVPAVEATGEQMLDIVGGSLLDFVANSWQSPRKITPEIAERVYSAAWLAVLNGPTRATAVALCTSLGAVQYGFHRRSIQGYAYARSKEEILEIQRIAANHIQLKIDKEKIARANKKAKAKAKVTARKKNPTAKRKKSP